MNIAQLLLASLLMVTPAVAADGEKSAPAKVAAADSTAQLDQLFEGLRLAPDPTIAKAIEQRIEARLMGQGSQTSALLMARAQQAFGHQKMEVASSLLESLVSLDPSFVEGRYTRATVAFQRKDYGVALAELEAAVTLEPRHFNAWAGLGVVFRALDQDKKALGAFQRAKALHPFIDKVDEAIKALADKVDGRDT